MKDQPEASDVGDRASHTEERSLEGRRRVKNRHLTEDRFRLHDIVVQLGVEGANAVAVTTFGPQTDIDAQGASPAGPIAQGG